MSHRAKNARKMAAVGFLIAGCISANESWSAADQPQGEAEDAGSRRKVEEIVVTAQKFEQNLQEVPISMQAFTAEDVVAKSVNGLQDLAQFVPNLTFSNQNSSGASGNIIYMRGIGTNDAGVEFSPGVGIYVDGIYMGVMRGLDLGLVDTERVEILRGPQGTLFGRNTVGGAINVISQRPRQRFEATTEVTVGSYDRLDGKLSVDVPLVPGILAAKFVASSRNRDGYSKRVDYVTGAKVDDQGDVDSLAGRVMLAWTPTSDWDVLISLDGTRSREHTNPYKPIVINPNIALNATVTPDWTSEFIARDDFTTFGTGPNKYDLDSAGASVIATWDLGNWTAKSLTAYRDVKSLYFVDVDGGPYALTHSYQDTREDQASQEFLVNGVSFDERLQSVFGVFYFDSTSESDRPGRIGQFATDPGPRFGPGPQQLDKTTSWATYAHGTYKLSDKFSFTGGLRYSTDEKDSKNRTLSRTDKWSAVTGRAGFEYRWAEEIMTYVSAARGYKSGGVNSIGTSSIGSAGSIFGPFDPEVVWTYEVGLKSDLLDRRLRLNVAAFYSDYTDIQFRIRVADPIVGVYSFVDNAAKARIQGFETELTAVTDAGLSFNLGVGYTDAKYTQLEPNSPVTTNTKFSETPEWSASAGVQYEMSLTKTSDVIGRLDYAYKTDVYHDVTADPLLKQPSFGLLNARLTYEHANDHWSVSLFGTNLTDEHYILGGINLLSTGFVAVQYARPREWGANFHYSF